MNRRQKIIVSVTGIFIVLLALLGLTFAYFLTQIRGNENPKSISVTTANLELTYGDGNGILLPAGLIVPSDKNIKFYVSNEETDDPTDVLMDGEMPIVKENKTFTVTNNGENASYVVIIDNAETKYANNGSYKDEDNQTVTYNKGDATEFLSNDFRYTLTCVVKDNEGNVLNDEKCSSVDTKSVFPVKGGILVGNSIEKERVHEYTLTMWYIDTGKDQSNDMNKLYQARVNIADVNRMENPFTTGVSATDSASLAYNIINNAKTSKNGTTFVNTPLTQVAEEISYYPTGKYGNVTATVLHGWYGGWSDLNYGPKLKDEYDDDESFYAALNYLYDDGEGDFDSLEICESVKNQYIFNFYLEEDPLIGKVLDCKSDGTPIIEGEIYESERTLSVASDDYGISYYFRGLPNDNYVNFAGMCWRIVRIDGNGNTKLILEDQDEVCSKSMNGNWDIEASNGTTITMNDSEPYRTGNFGYNDAGISYLNPEDSYFSEENETNFAMVNAFKYFQTKTLANKINSIYEGKSLSDFLVSGNWCLNDKISSDGAYDSYVRLSGENGNGYSPTLKCPVVTMETFGDNTTPMYVGTLTADEIVHAGGKVYEVSPLNYYLLNEWQYSNNKSFYSLSPLSFYHGDLVIFGVHNNGYFGYTGVSGYDCSFRPSISLKSGSVITKGDGTLERPYVIG